MGLGQNWDLIACFHCIDTDYVQTNDGLTRVQWKQEKR
jgi:hypothetical protein